MDSSILGALVGVGATSLVSIITAFAAGKLHLVSGARWARIGEESAKWEQAFRSSQAQVAQHTEMLQKQQLTAEITNSVLTALKTAAQSRSGGTGTSTPPLPPGGN